MSFEIYSNIFDFFTEVVFHGQSLVISALSRYIVSKILKKTHNTQRRSPGDVGEAWKYCEL